MLDRLLQDVRYALRAFAKRPGFTLAAVSILALGIGATSSIFSVAHGVLLRPLPYPEPDRLVRLWPDALINKRALLAVEDGAPAFSHVSAFGTWMMPLTEGGEPEVISVGRVSRGHFAVMGVPAVLGRTFEVADHEPAGNQVAVLSHGLWQRRFGGSQEVLGRRLEINGRPHTVVGVLPRGYRSLDPRWQVWTPLVADRGNSEDLDSSFYLRMVGRLRPGASVEQAAAQVEAIAWSLVEENPERFTRDRAEAARVVDLHGEIVSAVRPTLLILLAAVGAILLVACANIANLLLSRTAGRRREMAVRAALGADRPRLLSQLLIEGMVLATSGGAVGLLLALWVFDALRAQLPADLPRVSEIAFDGPVLLFSLGATVLSALFFGIAPALRLAGYELRSPLADRTGQGASRQRLASALVVFQVAASATLLVTALLLVASLVRLREVDPGFDGDHVLALRPVLSPARYTSEQAAQYYGQAFERLQALAKVEEVGAIQILPLSDENWSFPFRYEGQQLASASQPKGTSLPTANFRVVTPEYFSTLGVPLIRGRGFAASDHGEGPRVGLINRTLAEQLWPAGEAVGKRMFLFGDEDHAFTVVGVVGDVRQQHLAEAARAEIYWPLTQSGEFGIRSMAILVRTQGPPLELVAAARGALQSIDPNMPITEVAALPQILDAQVAEPRLIALLTSSFALLALVLGMVGVYGVISCAVAERVREIGIRMALGAAGDTVVGEILRAGMRLVVAGLVIGLATALGVGQMMRHQLFAVEPVNWQITGIAMISILLAALLALWLPARRASQVEPTVALRYE